MATNADFLSYVSGRGASFQKYAAGTRRYGGGSRSAPNVGPVGDKSGYRKRDRKAKTRRKYALARMQAGQSGRFMSADYLRPQTRD